MKLNFTWFQINFLCSMECNRKDFCEAYCIVDYECRLTNFVISPQSGPNDLDHVTCYSKRRSGNHILRAKAATSNPVGNTRHPLFLTKGIFSIMTGEKQSLLFEKAQMPTCYSNFLLKFWLTWLPSALKIIWTKCPIVGLK